ncbi:MAG: diguanylate phosphodiesterase, partial [Hyphomicrobiales bacterium]|nr:diguanylate phosphodiesterase [Hyphomicrobiales bacterium]
RELGVMVLAEGVETRAELDALAPMGIDLYQGFLFGKPGIGSLHGGQAVLVR